MTRVADKIAEIEEYLGQLSEIIPNTIEEYKGSLEKKAACERYLEKIVEAATDLAFLVVKIKKLSIPEDDAHAFSILAEQKVIDEVLEKKLKDAKGMKNIIAHQYGKIDDTIVFEAVTEDLEKDIEAFITCVEKAMK